MSKIGKMFHLSEPEEFFLVAKNCHVRFCGPLNTLENVRYFKAPRLLEKICNEILHCVGE